MIDLFREHQRKNLARPDKALVVSQPPGLLGTGMFKPRYLVLLLLAACGPDETISGFVDPATTYQLTEINGQAYAASATITFPEEGLIQGKAPCNSYSGEQTAPYPWFETSTLMVTRATCPQAAQERAFFAALGNMSLIEATGNFLILQNDDGDEMVFEAAQE